ncbi:hypothetical protein [Methylosinus sporium]|uniref:hypothetical protein n=1 Tax=Methylosinus sporium TaxID=428 RepID=UPI0011B1E863|nr:hypothetical protein [Methylosinus sporium]
MSKVDELVKIVARIVDLSSDAGFHPIGDARQLPGKYSRAAQNLIMSRDEKSPVVARAKEIVGEEERARGERERDQLLSEYSAELEGLRAILPSIAAAASIEIGVRARAIASEAKSGGAQ